VSDKARYCAHCGVQLVAEMVAGELSEAHCPCCEEEVRLANRRLSKSRVSVLECPHCGGLWLGISSFMILRDRIACQSSHLKLDGNGPPRLKTSDPTREVRYRKCIVCGRLMHRRQYGKGSGVIIDTCRSHGIWFDDGELQQVLEWIRLGGRTDRPIKPEVLNQQAQQSSVSTEPSLPGDSVHHVPSVPFPRDFLDNVFDGLFSHFGSLFD
jgi:Zn-finger nucleic acid-binding protein